MPKHSRPDRRRSTPVTSSKVLLCAAIAAAALVGSLARPVAATAATPCWKALLTDWYDGRIDNTYPLHCYTQALNHLPPDVQTYSSAHDDIERALASAKAKLRKAGKTNITPNTKIPPVGKKARKGGSHSVTTSTTSTTTSTTPLPGHKSGGGISSVADKLNPSSPSALPLPLLVLGALAILLVAAGGAGLIAKRYQGRKPAP